jgi:murein DD-endopeptidase MepM/ murein hydrolase activator NlpD
LVTGEWKMPDGTLGRIAIRDANGFLHEILHTHTRHVAIGDPVAAGQLIGTMGNTGVDRKNLKRATIMSTIKCGIVTAIG